MGRAHRHGMRVVLLVQLGWSRLLRASLAQLGVLVAHLDQSGVLEAGFAVVPGGVCWHLLAYERRVTRGERRGANEQSVVMKRYKLRVAE